MHAGVGDARLDESRGLVLLAACRALLPDDEQSSAQEMRVLGELHAAARSRLDPAAAGGALPYTYPLTPMYPLTPV